LKGYRFLPHHAELVARLALGIFSEESFRKAQGPRWNDYPVQLTNKTLDISRRLSNEEVILVLAAGADKFCVIGKSYHTRYNPCEKCDISEYSLGKRDYSVLVKYNWSLNQRVSLTDIKKLSEFLRSSKY
jgi:hypothetical protein